MAQRGCARMSSEDESEIENMRLLETLTHENRSAKVYFSKDWGEFRVKFYERIDTYDPLDSPEWSYCAEADYFTTDKVDAFGTAEFWAGPAVR